MDSCADKVNKNMELKPAYLSSVTSSSTYCLCDVASSLTSLCVSFLSKKNGNNNATYFSIVLRIGIVNTCPLRNLELNYRVRHVGKLTNTAVLGIPNRC